MIAKATKEHLSHASRALREPQTKGREIYERVAEIEGKGTTAKA